MNFNTVSRMISSPVCQNVRNSVVSTTRTAIRSYQTERALEASNLKKASDALKRYYTKEGRETFKELWATDEKISTAYSSLLIGGVLGAAGVYWGVSIPVNDGYGDSVGEKTLLGLVGGGLGASTGTLVGYLVGVVSHSPKIPVLIISGLALTRIAAHISAKHDLENKMRNQAYLKN